MTVPPDKRDAALQIVADAVGARYTKTFRDSVLKWFTRFGTLKDRDNVLIKHPNVKLYAVQRKMFEHYDKCLAANKPCKEIVLKWRKGGASTGAQAMMYHRGRRFSGRAGAIMGDIAGTSDQVFEIYRRFAENDLFDWDDGFPNLRPDDKERNRTDDITLPNGSTYIKVTAGSTNANRGGTIQFANSTETAYYPMNLERDPLTSFLGSWSEHTESSLGLIDSTSNGPFGRYYDYFMDERNGWEKIFCAWFEDEENAIPFATLDDEKRFKRELLKHEQEQMERFNLRLEQVNWLRDKFVSKCGGSLEQLNKEYPPSPEDAFLKKSALRFDVVKLSKMEIVADSIAPGKYVVQTERDDNGHVVAGTFIPDEKGEVEIWEMPKFGCRYAMIVDSCTGQDQQSKGQSADPDWHSVGIIRDAYLDPRNGDFLPPMVVAHHYSRLESEVMCEVAAGMAAAYGRCIAVVEVNGCGLYPVKKLAELGVKLWERTRKAAPNAMINDSSAGWFTSEVVRKTIVDNLAGLIARWEEGKRTFECLSPHVIKQLKKFVLTPSGRSEALPGEHDDDVLMLAIGLYVTPTVATEMRLPERKKIDITKLMKREGWRAIGGVRM